MKTLKSYRSGIGYNRRGYKWSKSVARFKRTGKFRNVQQGQGHAAGEAWGDAKQIDPTSRQRRYSKNSTSFDEGVYLSKKKRKESLVKALDKAKE